MPKLWSSKTKDGRKVSVRFAKTNDAPILHQGFGNVVDEGKWLPSIKANATVQDWVSWIARTGHTREVILVAFVDEDYAGHLTLQPEEWMASGHVAKLGIIVQNDYRNLGVGRFLMKTAEEVAINTGFEKIILSTFHNNKIANALYVSLGYRKVGVRKNHFKMPEGYIDEILMEKQIPNESA